MTSRPASSPSTIDPSQRWTVDGYPIVDGKYQNLAMDKTKAHTGVFGGGPSLTDHLLEQLRRYHRSRAFYLSMAL
jgi:hypothetical protein